jgi:PleD family two-component response regulator
VVTDLDEFKLVNDIYGHFAGDEAIKRFAMVLKANTLFSDMCGRLGTDEFLLVMTRGDKKSIVHTIDRLRVISPCLEWPTGSYHCEFWNCGARWDWRAHAAGPACSGRLCPVLGEGFWKESS